MQIRLGKEDPEKIKALLQGYRKEDIKYNEPHFTLKLEKQNIDRKEVIKHILKPDRLVLAGVTEAKNPSYKYVHDLYFQTHSNRILKIPTSIRPKALYLITIILIQRDLQYEATKY